MKTKAAWGCVLFVLTALPVSAQSRYKFVSPGAAAADALTRSQLCEDIIRAGGQCDPGGPESTDAMRERFIRLVNYNAQVLQQQQQAERQLQNATMPMALQIGALELEVEHLKSELQTLKATLQEILSKLNER